MSDFVPGPGTRLSWIARTLVVHAIGFAAVAGAAAQIPAEVEHLSWCPGSRDCLAWTAVADATGYRVHRGGPSDLPALMTDATDACTLGTFDTTTSGVFFEAAMSPGLLRWYLVTAAAGIDEGPSGTGSFGPRALDSLGACGAGPRLLINEIDYDQPGTDGAEFVEVLNAGDAPADLAGLVLVFVNGLTSQEYARVTLDAAGPSLEPGAYLVIGTDGVLATLPAGTASIALPASANNIQNGAPDGVALFDPGALRVLDALAYEGAIHAAVFDGATGTFDLVEGTPATAVDSGTGDGSLARVPDGADSGNADVDWRFASTPTPGMANPTP